jgi:hypothetical protein
MRHKKDIVHYEHPCVYYAVSREAFFSFRAI